MKKMMVFLFAAALMLVPMSAGAAMQSISDSEMAAVTGQAGVDITVSSTNIGLKLKSITWGDPDGIDGTAADAGYVNLAMAPLQMLATVTSLVLGIDVGTVASSPAETAVQITVSAATITLDAFLTAIYFDSANAVALDKTGTTAGTPYAYAYGDVTTWVSNASSSKCVGIVGLSGLEVALGGPTTIQISAH